MISYHVVVIGGGHAGTEAANAAARLGARTLLLTQNLETIGQMSCNPAIGGIAKGTVVREVDALGGVMGRATDRACIQFRMLNRAKGPAVWSPRAQCDRTLYRRAARSLLERQPLLALVQGTVVNIEMKGGRAAAVITREGWRYETRAVVLTAGTFLQGRIHLGLRTSIPAGRAGDAPANELSEVLREYGLTVERFKTGTPPRIDGRSLDLARFERQDSDPDPYWFSAYEQSSRLDSRPCFLAYAGDRVKEVIRRHLAESALYGGEITARGPRYCPSIEDKVVKFPAAERHQLFLEPEGLETEELYVNGLSTSLPAEVQLEMVHAGPGLERAALTRAGYAIEYDYFPPTQLDSTLQVQNIQGLYFAGQINGTTGYEEAAGQGLLAGLNAAASALGRDPVVFGRDQAMIGVLIDDLVSRGVDEPYRLFTSRAEFRLLLRHDNAVRRLFPLASGLGLLTVAEHNRGVELEKHEDAALEFAQGHSISPELARPILVEARSPHITEPCRIAGLVRRPRVKLWALLRAAGWSGTEAAADWAEVELKYEGYLARERDAAQRLQELTDIEIPVELSFDSLQGLTMEAREKLSRVRPSTLGHAARVPGVSPNDLQNLITAVTRLRAGRLVSRETPPPPFDQAAPVATRRGLFT